MHDFIKMYADKGKVGFVNRASLSLYRNTPMLLREWLVYPMWLVRKAKIPKTKFVIFAQGRTGSTLLVDLLNSHPDVFTYGEIFRDGVIRNVRFPRIYAEALCSLSKAPVCGFKVKILQLSHAQQKDPGETLWDFYRHGWHIIYLKRDNYLRHAISDMLSEATRVYHNVEGAYVGDEKKAKSRKIHVDYNELFGIMQDLETRQQNEREALRGIPHHTVTYEDDLMGVDNQRRILSSLFEFLGLPEHDASTGMRKVAAKNLADNVENFAEIEERLRETKFASFL